MEVTIQIVGHSAFTANTFVPPTIAAGGEVDTRDLPPDSILASNVIEKS